MSSSVFFKFKSQREPTRVEFDGTGISVFELKREIINKSGLGDGSDFDLFIYTDDNTEEYDDDTTIIPRSTTVIARRQPALKPGAGRAARYVSGKMPVSAKNAGRREQAGKASSSKPMSTAISQMNNAMTEDEKMAAMFAAQTEQWSAQQEEMSHHAPAFKPGQKRPANVPEHEPPNGYICYRCGQKGHWIQVCPTNDDPEFDNRPRVKRTTGIPRAFQKKVDKAVILAQSDGDETKRPSGIMVNAEGDFVIAEPDKAAWEKFQAKAKTTSAAAKDNAAEAKEIQDRGLECSIDKKMFIDPMKTPCCQKIFCNDCITNALIESDFVCPSCQTEGVLIDDLVPDEEASKKIQEYLKEKEAEKTPQPASPQEAKGEESTQDKESASEDKASGEADKDAAKSPTSTQSAKAKSPPTGPASGSAGQSNAEKATGTDSSSTDPSKPSESNAKKRPADEMMENPKIPKGPKAMQNQQNQQNQQNNQMPNMMNMPDMGMNGMNMFNGMNGMMPNMMGMPGMNMNMGMPMMGMPMMGMNGFGMNGNYGMNGWDMNNMGNMGNMGGMGGMNGGYNNNYGGPNNMNGRGGGNGHGQGGGYPNMNMNMNNMNMPNFQQSGTEDDAYFRKPVNPHRHQNKQRRVRPSDYREL